MNDRPAVIAVALAALIVAAATPAFGQCCCGAYNVTQESKNGLYKVEAESLTGTGHGHHGPYQYKFRCFEKSGGRFQERRSFEMTYDSRNCFSMDVYVSPTGNGFLLDTTPATEIVFFGTSGRVLRSYKRSDLKIGTREEKPAGDGVTLQLLDPALVPVPGSKGLSHMYVERGRFYLPLAGPFGDDQEAKALAMLSLPADATKEEREAMNKLVATLGDDKLDAREEAGRQLVARGPIAIDALRAATAADNADVRNRATSLIDEIQDRSFGYMHPLRDLGLLITLVTYPCAKIATLASERLTAILPDLPEILAKELHRPGLQQWLPAHAEEFRWDDVAKCYRWKGARK